MSAQVTEAHRELAYAILFATEDGHAGPNETAQLIADSEAKATAELKKRADHWCDMHTVCAKKANQLRAELATCKDASEALVESLRAEVEWLRECYDQTSALCGKFITEDDGTDLIPNSARIANALTRLEARAERAESELAAAKLLLNEETDCAEAVEAAIVRQYARAERAEAEIKDRAAMMRDVMRERDAAEAELKEWSLLNLWGGTPEIIHNFVKGQQARIHAAQDLECELESAKERALTLANLLDQAQTELAELKESVLVQQIFSDDRIRAERAEAELAGIRALADRRNKRYHVEDTTHQLVAALDQALDIAQAELKAERARLDWIMSGRVVLVPNGSGHYVSRLHYPVSRAAIDAAMKEDA